MEKSIQNASKKEENCDLLFKI